MPTIGGGEAYDRLKEINQNVKVLLLTGFRIDGEATEILGRGRNGLIQKLFRMNELVEKIRGCAEAYRGASHKQLRSLTPIQPFSRSAVVAEATMAKSARSQCFGEVGS